MREAPNAIIAAFARRDSTLRANASLALELMERIAAIALCVVVMLAIGKLIDFLSKPDPATMTAQPSAAMYERLEGRVESLEKRLQRAERRAFVNSRPGFTGMTKKEESK